MTDEKFESLLDRVAGLFLHLEFDLRAFTKDLSDAEVADFARRLVAIHPANTSFWGGGWRHLTKQSLTSELDARIHFNRARELNAEVYCVYHACDTKDCPAGFHDDD